MFQYHAPSALLKDKTILVTGAGDGIGKVAALHYAKHGATVILLGKTVNKLTTTYDEIEAETGIKPAIIPLDLSGATEQNYRDMADTIEQQFGKLDGLLHNASLLGSLGPFEHIDIAALEAVFKVNVTAQVMMTKALLPVLRKADNASIIFTSSGVGRKGRAYWGAYSFSKFVTESMMQVLADECAETTIRVNSIDPGATRTNMRASAYPAENPLNLKTPTEIMPVYLYLMGNDSIKENGNAFSAQ